MPASTSPGVHWAGRSTVRVGRVSVTRQVYVRAPTGFGWAVSRAAARRASGRSPGSARACGCAPAPGDQPDLAAARLVHVASRRRSWPPRARSAGGRTRRPAAAPAGRRPARPRCGRWRRSRSSGDESSTSRTRYGPAAGACRRSHAAIPHGEVPSARGQNRVDSRCTCFCRASKRAPNPTVSPAAGRTAVPPAGRRCPAPPPGAASRPDRPRRPARPAPRCRRWCRRPGPAGPHRGAGRRAGR